MLFISFGCLLHSPGRTDYRLPCGADSRDYNRSGCIYLFTTRLHSLVYHRMLSFTWEPKPINHCDWITMITVCLTCDSLHVAILRLDTTTASGNTRIATNCYLLSPRAGAHSNIATLMPILPIKRPGGLGLGCQELSLNRS